MGTPDTTTDTRLPPVGSGYVSVADTALAVERRGRGRPLLLIHGVAEDAILLSTIVGFPVGVDDPAFAAARANAEAMILDEPSITLARFEPETLTGVDVTIVLGNKPLELISDAARQFERWTGRPRVVVDAPHEVYLTDPSVLTGVVASQL